MAKKAETKTEETALEKVAPPGAMVEFVDYGEDMGKGFEGQGKADTSIPFIVQLQSLSPQVVAETAKAGQWYNTITGKVYDRDEGFLFVPAITRNVFAEWTPRDQGGGFHGHHEIDSPEVAKAIKESKKFGKYRIEVEEEDADGKIVKAIHQLTETFYVYGALCSEDGLAEGMAAIAFTSTKIRPYRTWMTRLRQFTMRTPNGLVRPPLYGHLTRFTSHFEDKGPKKKYYIPVINPADPRGIPWSLLQPTDERFLMAKEVAKLMESGKAKVDYSQSAGDAEEEGDASFDFGKDS